MARFHDMTVMRLPIEKRCRHLGIAEYAGLFGEGQVRRDHHAGVLVALRQQREEQGTAGLAEGQITQRIEDHEIHAHQCQGAQVVPAW